MIRIINTTSIVFVFLFSLNIAKADGDIQELEDRLRQMDGSEHQSMKLDISDIKRWAPLAEALSEEGPEASTGCVDYKVADMAGKYAVSFDEAGQVCRIYDLSFPTLETLFAGESVARLPVQSFSARDYLNWMDERYDLVLNKMATFKTDFTSSPDLSLARWVKKVEFKPTSMSAIGAVPEVEETGLPTRFRASDLDLGGAFEFSKADQKRLLQALEQADLAGAASGFSMFSADERSAWERAILHPETLLAQIQFEWSDAEKVYEILIDGEFLPIRGPVALVDHGASHKIAVERILRAIVRAALNQAIRFIPGQAQAIVSLAINESFDFIDMAYDYQINQLEGTLRAAGRGEIPSQLDAQSIDRSMNILFGGRSDIVSEYLTAVLQKRAFEWDKFDDVGRRLRHTIEKQRDIMITNLNSSMVQRKGCEMTLMDDYFGVCSKNDSKATYSMISENRVLFWSLGAPMIYQHDRTAQVMLMRSATYLLAIGARSFNLPIASYFTGILADSLESYAFAGVVDEAFLRNSIYLEKLTTGSLTSESEVMMRWLYLQNLNPFLPKTAGMEQSVINANARLLSMDPQEPLASPLRELN